MFLTQLAIKNAKPREKPYKLRDGNGLYLLVNPNGSKPWRLRYRSATSRTCSASERSPKSHLRQLALSGMKRENFSPKALTLHSNEGSTRSPRRTAARNTFGALVEDYLAKLEDEGSAESTMSKNRWLLQELAAPLAKMLPKKARTYIVARQGTAAGTINSNKELPPHLKTNWDGPIRR